MKIKTLHGYKNNVRDEFERIKKDLQHFKLVESKGTRGAVNGKKMTRLGLRPIKDSRLRLSIPRPRLKLHHSGLIPRPQ